jgi:hypothetical protein
MPKSDRNLLSECKKLYETYNNGDFAEFDETIERIALGWGSNPSRIVTRMEMELTGLSKFRKFLVGDNGR